MRAISAAVEADGEGGLGEGGGHVLVVEEAAGDVAVDLEGGTVEGVVALAGGGPAEGGQLGGQDPAAVRVAGCGRTEPCRLAGSGVAGRGRAGRAGRPGPRAAAPGRGRPASGSVRPEMWRLGGASTQPPRPRQSTWARPRGGRLPSPVGVNQWCQPPPPVATSGPGSRRSAASWSWRRAARPAGPSMSRASKQMPVARPTLAWGQRCHQRPMRSGSVVASLTPWRTRGCLAGRSQPGPRGQEQARLAPPGMGRGQWTG